MEAIPCFISTLSRWEPDTTETTSLGSCVDNSGRHNSNDCSAQPNNWRGLWEFIDTDTGNTDHYSDGVDITLVGIMDGLVEWQESPCVQGQNRSSCEMYRVQDNPPQACTNSEQCAPAHVCDGGWCYGGDPHGNNLRDWVHHLAAVTPPSESTYWKTMVSSPCIGRSDDSYPFDPPWGGYHYW